MVRGNGVHEGGAGLRPGVRVGVPPVSAVFAYHAEVLKTFEESGELTSEDFVRLRRRNEAVFDALAAMAKEDSE